MASVSASPTSQTTATWTISGLAYDWNVSNYSQAYVRFNSQTSVPQYPPSTGTSRFVSGTISGLTAGATYTVEGFMVQTGGTFPAGTTTIKMPENPPSSLTGLTNVGVTINSISVTWYISERASGYHMYRNNNYVTSVAGTFYTHTGLTSNTPYRIGVIPYNSSGTGQGQNIDVTTLKPRPDNFNWKYAGLNPTTGAVVSGTSKQSTYGFYIHATNEWNVFMDRIQEFRVNYKGIGSATLLYAVSSQPFTANHFNYARNAIAPMNSNVPGIKNTGDVIYASDLNWLVSSLNNIT